ncbi:hypothetical protein GIB67_032973 [Kingdonia uniflora]|uniref:Zinc finger protein n=1 Tax=Kingdonia uniflora TaxID=39325 RepID=A0A7J7MY60_9MAGN|nr:hypothetical protein GIB67_032973 [Kingdonia uniflora]
MLVSISGVRLVDAPILLLVCFHKALRAELVELHGITSLSVEIESPARALILDLLARFRFLKLAYKYHCAAEDEIVFESLDLREENVVCAYSLEHRSIDELFVSVFRIINRLMEEDEILPQTLRELDICTDTIEKSICRHMLKEEEQVFPLLMQRFSFKEQASLVWQFICSVPIMLLEELLPWMTSYLPKEEQADVILCIKEVVPTEKLIQKVVMSWLDKRNEPSFRVLHRRDTVNLYSISNEPISLKELPKVYTFWKSLYGEDCSSEGKIYHTDNAKDHPIDGLRLWHTSIKKDLNEILDELHEIRSSMVFSTLASVSCQLKFIADVLIFNSAALENVFFSVLSEVASDCLSFTYQRFPSNSQIEGLFRILQDINAQNEICLPKLAEKLCLQLEYFMTGLAKHFAFQESEVFTLIRKHCNLELQQRLLYTSLHMMPLGLLKFVITWLSTHLTEEETKAFLCSIKPAGSEADISFASLLHEWVHIGYSGKTSLEKFRRELQEMFKNRSSFLSEQIENTGFSLDTSVQPCKRHEHGQVSSNSPDKSISDTSFHKTKEKYNTLYSSEINLQIHFPEALKELFPLSKFLIEKRDVGSSLNLPFKPIDHIIFFHKALKKELEYFVLVSAEIAENFGLFTEFHKRFHLVTFLYKIHSDTEDEIAFPALVAKGNLLNISDSYTMDHKLEGEYFNDISTLLDEISELQFEISTCVDATMDWRMLKYRQMCIKLHGMCKTICSTLGNHVNREETDLWPLFMECFSYEEQEKIIGIILGRTTAETLQHMIPWLMTSLSRGEKDDLMSLWRKIARNTMFDEWLSEWWEGLNKKHDLAEVTQKPNISQLGTADPLEIVANYLTTGGHGEGFTYLEVGPTGYDLEPHGNGILDFKAKKTDGDTNNYQCSECAQLHEMNDKQSTEKVVNVRDQVRKPGKLLPVNHKEHFLSMSQEDLEAAIRRVSRDLTLNPQKKAYILQTLLTSRWIVNQQKPPSDATLTSNEVEIPGKFSSYRDELKLSYGCKHYKRNCKLFAACCKQLFTCRYCHDDDVSDHSMDRKSTTKMMCMKCLEIQPLAQKCSSLSCDGLSMAKYFCNICKLYDDDREIYHCPYCNLCRVGKGLGVEYFHCMNCNACLSKSLVIHVCREKCFESNCPICHEDIFTSILPVKALPCGHTMHSTCFQVFILNSFGIWCYLMFCCQEYTNTHYTCPICSKSLGDMQVYFGMLDVLLAEEKVPDEHYGQTQGSLPSIGFTTNVLTVALTTPDFFDWGQIPGVIVSLKLHNS